MLLCRQRGRRRSGRQRWLSARSGSSRSQYLRPALSVGDHSLETVVEARECSLALDDEELGGQVGFEDGRGGDGSVGDVPARGGPGARVDEVVGFLSPGGPRPLARGRGGDGEGVAGELSDWPLVHDSYVPGLALLVRAEGD